MWLLLAATPIVLLITYYVSFMTHEYGHSFAAWMLGIKSSPWPITWGSNTIGNFLFLSEVDEHVDYDAAMASGKNLAVAVVALSGIAVNALLYLVFRFAAPLWRTSTHALVAYSTFWLFAMEVGNFFCYVPIRVASPSGDMHNWTVGSHQSWWWLYVIIGYLTLWAMVDFYRTVLPESLDASDIRARVGRALVLVTATLLLFGYFAGPGLMKDDDLTQFISRTSLLLIPVVLLVSWRRVVRSGLSAHRRGLACAHQPDDAIAETNGNGEHNQPGKQQPEQQHQVPHNENHCVPASFHLTHKALVLLGRRPADRFGHECDIDSAVLDAVAERVALGTQTVQISLALGECVLGGDQRFGIPGVAHDGQQAIHRGLQGLDARVEIDPLCRHILGRGYGRLHRSQSLELPHHTVELGHRDAQHHRRAGESPVRSRILAATVHPTVDVLHHDGCLVRGLRGIGNRDGHRRGLHDIARGVLHRQGLLLGWSLWRAGGGAIREFGRGRVVAQGRP